MQYEYLLTNIKDRILHHKEVLKTSHLYNKQTIREIRDNIKRDEKQLKKYREVLDRTDFTNL